jgi:alpha-galactosidase
MGSEKTAKSIELENDVVQVILHVDENGGTFLQDVLPKGAKAQKSESPYFESSLTPLVEVRLSGEGNRFSKTSKSLIGSYVGERLKYKSHKERTEGDAKTLDVELEDEKTKVIVTSHITLFDGIPFLRASATIKNSSDQDVVVTQLTSIVIGGMTKTKEWWNGYDVAYANNTWFREAQWADHTLPSLGIDDFGVFGIPGFKHESSLAHFELSNHSSFSTQGHLPMGILKQRDGSETWLWQVENNGSWKWEIGDFKDSIYLAATGPEAVGHDWRQKLAPGESFMSVTVGLCHLFDDSEAVFQALTQYRRRIRRKHIDHEKVPIIFNDYMNCLMGDPTDEKILALVGPVSKSGADYFVIDCGWYADDGDWWDDVGLWEPSKKRFPMGFKELLGKIKEHNLIPGLWIETEVVGIRSVMADRLPNEAFFQRDGHRIVEKGRYQLDYRHSAVRKRMDEVVDNLVQNYGVGYFKFDYNIEITQGTDINTSSPGAAALDHNRAYLKWVGSLLDRYPDLVVENCSSGAQRMDYAGLAVHTLESTSDQQDPVKYAAIAAAIPTAVTPEQGATWAYPQPEWSDEINALTVVNTLLGRIHLSGRLDATDSRQLDIIYEGLEVYKQIRHDIPTSLPFWPLGLPKWHDKWLALGLKTKDGRKCYLAVWRRGGKESIVLPIRPFLGKEKVSVELLYPKKFEAEAEWYPSTSSVKVKLPATTCARLFCLQA